MVFFLHIYLFKTQFTQSRVFHLFQENRKNQKSLCPESCLQNMIGYGPVNVDKIKEASVQGRVVFYLPRTLRRDEERLLHGVSEIFPDTAAVISLIIIVTVFMYKIISTRKTRKTSSNTPIPVKSASPSSASSFIIGSTYKLYLLPYYLNYYTFLDHKVILYHNMVLAIISCIFTRNGEERRRVNLKTSNIRFEGGRVLGGVGARPRGGRGPGPEAGGEAGQRGGHQTSLASGGRPPGGARPPLRPWPRSRRTRGHS